jgi:hypothetical protein
LQAGFLTVILAVPVTAQTTDEPVVAFVDGTTLSLAASSGKVTQTIDLKKPVYNFALSKDRKRLVTVSADTETGGNLYLLNLQTHTKTKLTNGHLYFKTKELDKNETEVYDDPQFSPDGRSLAFAIHTDNPGDGNDAENDSGPIAVMDLQTRKVRVLKSTENIDGQGFCSTNTLIWSPDGKWILFNCENGAFITDPMGKTIRELKYGNDQATVDFAFSWVGNHCILTENEREAQMGEPKTDQYFLLNLTFSTTRNPESLFTLPQWNAEGLIEASEKVLIRQADSGITIETGEKSWNFLKKQDSWKNPPAHILGGWRPSSIPAECK